MRHTQKAWRRAVGSALAEALVDRAPFGAYLPFRRLVSALTGQSPSREIHTNTHPTPRSEMTLRCRAEYWDLSPTLREKIGEPPFQKSAQGVRAFKRREKKPLGSRNPKFLPSLKNL